jgi:DNA/RNA endonuclease YhcR with UshA esterase domain
MQKQQPETPLSEAVCPQCGGFIGAGLRCARCGAPVRQRLSLRAVRIAAVLLATLGLGLLYLCAVARQTPPVEIGSITPAMNFAQVQLTGRVLDDPHVVRRNGRVRFAVFSIDDRTGEAKVFLSAQAVQALQAGAGLPAAEDRVALRGSLSVAGEGLPVLRVPAAQQVQVERTPALKLRLDQITDDREGQIVEVQAVVREVRRPASGSRAPWRVRLADETGALPLVFWPPAEREPELVPGQLVQCRARVQRYRETLQLKLSRMQDLKLVAAPITKPVERMPLSALSPALAGTRVNVVGEVTDLTVPPPDRRAPYRLLLRQGGVTLPAVCWPAEAEALTDRVEPGTCCEVTAEVSLYQGRLQLKVREAAHIRPVPSEALPEPEETAGLSPALTGQWLTVTGTVSAVQIPEPGRSAPCRISLRTAYGACQAVYWPAEGDQPSRELPVEGVRLAARGRVELYRSRPQLRIVRKADLRVLEAEVPP